MTHRSFHRSQHNLIGMIHLQALPGAPEYEGSMPKVLDFALREAQILVSFLGGRGSFLGYIIVRICIGDVFYK